jgi:hypothetical protein
MKTIFLSACAILCSITIYASDNELLDTKTLLGFLPCSDVNEYTRMEIPVPPGDKTSSGVVVNYMKMSTIMEKNAETAAVIIMIMDCNKHRDTIESQIKPQYDGDAVTTVNGTYKGRKNNKTMSDNKKKCSVDFIVANRFVVSVNVIGSDDFTLAEKFIALIDLKGLEAAGTKK